MASLAADVGLYPAYDPAGKSKGGEMVDVDANDRKGVSDSSTSDVELVDSANGRPAYSHQ